MERELEKWLDEIMRTDAEEYARTHTGYAPLTEEQIAAAAEVTRELLREDDEKIMSELERRMQAAYEAMSKLIYSTPQEFTYLGKSELKASDFSRDDSNYATYGKVKK